MTEEKKKNLTIRIDKQVLEKARKLGLNLSATTESMLKTASFIKEKETVKTSELREIYRKIFIEIIDIMKEWGIGYYLEIGGYISLEEFSGSKGKISEHQIQHEYYLDPSGRITHYISEFEKTVEIWRLNEDWPVQHIYQSEKIISKLIDLLYGTAEENKKRLEDVTLLKKVLEKLTERKKEKENGKT